MIDVLFCPIIGTSFHEISMAVDEIGFTVTP